MRGNFQTKMYENLEEVRQILPMLFFYGEYQDIIHNYFIALFIGQLFPNYVYKLLP